MLVAALVGCVMVAAVLVAMTLAVVAVLRRRSLNSQSTSPSSDQGDVITCDIELVILDETLQLNNYGDSSIRLTGTGLESSTLLYPSDVWMNKFDSRHSCVFHIFAVQQNNLAEQRVLELKVTAIDVAVKPSDHMSQLHYTMWKLKPTVYMQATHIMEHRIFNGQLLKTINFSRAPARYYKIRATTRPTFLIGGLFSGSNTGCKVVGSGRLQIMSARIEPERTAAMNLSDRLIKATVVQSESGDSLNRKLSDRMLDLPSTGVCSYFIRPKHSSVYKNLLRMRLTRQSMAIEPPNKFGSLPLYCDIDLLDKTAGRARKIASAEVLSELQLPRKSYTYIVTFSVAIGDEEGLRDDDTSCTLE